MIEIINDDCLNVIEKLDDNTINCVITSPPYNVDLGNNKYNKTPYLLYKDNKEHKEYIDWLINIFDKMYNKLVEGGRICINIGDGKNGAVPTHVDLMYHLSKRFIPITSIVWDKHQVRNRTSWGSFLSPSCPSYPTPFEYILILAKGNKKLQHKGETDLTKEEFITYAYGIWSFTPETKAKKIGHPAPFPIELPYRLIKMNTYIGDKVFDPFLGSGTTAIACKQLNRNFIGCDIDSSYIKIAKQRLNDF